VPAASVTAGAQTTIAQLPIFITTAGGVAINGGNTVTGGANVTATDVEASNGVVHVIDRVLLPPTVEAIARYAGFTTLAGAVASQGLVDDLSGAGPFTVFAPTNEAFAALPAIPTGDALTNVLLYHVVGSAVPSSAITATPAPVASLAAAPYEVGGAAPNLSLLARLDGTTARINGVAVVTADIPAINGVVHVVGEVLLPMNIVDIAEAGGFSTLVTAVGAAAPLSGGGTVAGALSSGGLALHRVRADERRLHRRLPERPALGRRGRARRAALPRARVAHAGHRALERPPRRRDRSADAQRRHAPLRPRQPADGRR
jgi:uncharacterized surface protein with fasciclin (FAS1) repeats